MTSDDAYNLYLELAEIRKDLRDMSEHGLANLVNDRMCIVHNAMTAEDKKLAAIQLAGEGIA